jgi:hypothetical protein
MSASNEDDRITVRRRLSICGGKDEWQTEPGRFETETGGYGGSSRDLFRIRLVGNDDTDGNEIHLVIAVTILKHPSRFENARQALGRRLDRLCLTRHRTVARDRDEAKHD